MHRFVEIALALIVASSLNLPAFSAPAVLSKAERQKWLISVELGSDAPENPEDYIWQTKGLEPSQSLVPILIFDSYGYERAAGTIPVNTQVIPKYIRIFRRRHHYGFLNPKLPTSPIENSIVWISGDFLRLASFAGDK